MPKPVSQEFLDKLGHTLEQGVTLHRQGRLGEAEKIYARILKSLPDQFETLSLMAELKMASGRAGEALRLTTAAMAARPESANALVQHGHVLRVLKRDDDALASFEKALAREPNHIDALGSRGDALLVRRRAMEALHCFEKILALEPRHVEARINRGAAFAMLERFAEALADFDAVLAQSTQHPRALYNRANALSSLGRYAESIATFDRVLALVPQYVQAHNNRGNALLAAKRHAEAAASFATAIALQPDHADAQFNHSLALLAIADYPRGLAAYEWRWKRTGMTQRRNYGRPLWLGEFPLARKTILVHFEQGLGDAIQFARYVPLLARIGATVVLEVQAELKSLFSRLAGVSHVVARGEALPAFDFQCPLGSLPLAFKTEIATVPAEIPYLAADERRIAKWHAKMEALKRPRVALVWTGNVDHANDRNRSIALSKLKPLWENGATQFVSLQRDLRSSDADELKNSSMPHVGDALDDLDDTAAIVAQCDLVISVDTSVAHLAAAMGQPTWVLLPFSPDWRWTPDGEHSPWYPSARLFRQPQLGDWASVIARVRAELAAFGGLSA